MDSLSIGAESQVIKGRKAVRGLVEGAFERIVQSPLAAGQLRSCVVFSAMDMRRANRLCIVRTKCTVSHVAFLFNFQFWVLN